MAEVKAKVVVAFNDRTENNKMRKVDSVLTVPEERAKKLENLGYVKRVQNITENKEEKG